MKKIDKLNYTKIKNFCVKKDIIDRAKREPMNGRKYLQVIYLESYKDFDDSTTKNPNNPLKNTSKGQG